MTIVGPIMWLLYALLYVGSPLASYSYDRRNFDGYRYDVFCVAIYQQPETMRCMEVPR